MNWPNLNLDQLKRLENDSGQLGAWYQFKLETNKICPFRRATGIGALLQLHPSPHLAYDLRLQQPPAQRLLNPAGPCRANMPTTLTASGFNLGSSNLSPPTVTLPPPPGGSRPRSTALASMSSLSSSVHHRQLPQLSLSANPQVTVRSRHLSVKFSLYL